jgi:hypothetical protein
MLRICVEGAQMGTADSSFNFGNTNVTLEDLFEIAESREGRKLKWVRTENGLLTAKLRANSRYLIYATTDESQTLIDEWGTNG